MEIVEAERAIALAKDELAAAVEQEALRSAALLRQQDLQQRGVGTTASVEAAELAYPQQNNLFCRVAVAWINRMPVSIRQKRVWPVLNWRTMMHCAI